MDRTDGFWDIVDQLVKETEIVIDRQKGTSHPRFPDFVYQVDYGYLDGTSSMDQEGIDVWVGSEPDRKVDAMICIVDRLKRDSEIKLLLGCTEEEKKLVLEMCNRTEWMKGILVRR
ncbi:MAG: inorganic pyrophosphatase [Lachnospiraceae bacterium]|nr:inorganic pyrophosphatase [Lachnospiraceae bacterium]